MSAMEPLRYIPFSSQVELQFWHKLCDKKLDELKLSEEPVEIIGEFYINGNIKKAVAVVGFVPYDFPKENFGAHRLQAKLLNKNSVESFKKCDKKGLLEAPMRQVIESIKSGAALEDPAVLTRMFLLSYADLKKYFFYYWCAFPSVMITNTQFLLEPLSPISSHFSADQLAQLAEKVNDKAFALVNKTTFDVDPFTEIKNGISETHFIVFADPALSETNPGWPLRNFLLMVAFHMPKETADFDVIAWRGTIRELYVRSKVFRVRLHKVTFDEPGITYVGYEKNEKDESGPRLVNLSHCFDPVVQARTAIDLNLKLMKWRLAPDLKLKRISEMKCLILGAGTLGCNVARCLLGWGVEHLTLVDNGKVSLSNPVRQSLFTFDDACKGGQPKVKAAAAALKAIYPRLNVTPVELTIPMPGHNVSDAEVEAVRNAVNTLESHIEKNDAIFLLLDTREARWLPTLLGARHKKMVLNAALGFDSFLAMRHGTPVNKLGCYFCNDIVGPMNTTRDRTLDQQCTVTRPGVSYMAASFLIELFVTLVQHEQGNDAPPDNAFAETEDEEPVSHTNVLGLAPHQIRLFLSRLHFMTPSTQAFSMCTACSPIVLAEYERTGFPFLHRVFNEEDFLEEFTGLKEMQRLADGIDIVALEDSDNEVSLET